MSPSPSIHDLTSLLLSLQVAYDVISQEAALPQTLVKIAQLQHPNMSLQLRGVRSALVALKIWLAANPAVVLGLVGLGTEIVKKLPDEPKTPSVTIINGPVVIDNSRLDILVNVQRTLGKSEHDPDLMREVIERRARDVDLKPSTHVKIRKVELDSPDVEPPKAAARGGRESGYATP